jgi:hypothetical protein
MAGNNFTVYAGAQGIFQTSLTTQSALIVHASSSVGVRVKRILFMGGAQAAGENNPILINANRISSTATDFGTWTSGAYIAKKAIKNINSTVLASIAGIATVEPSAMTTERTFVYQPQLADAIPVDMYIDAGEAMVFTVQTIWGNYTTGQNVYISFAVECEE